MNLYNATTAVQFQPSQQKFSLLQAIPKHAVTTLSQCNKGDNFISKVVWSVFETPLWLYL